MRIDNNNKLRKLLSKGPKYREPRSICWDKTREVIGKGLDDFVLKWCAKRNENTVILDDWKHTILHKVEDRISVLNNRLTPHTINEVLKDHSAKSALKELQSKYVIVPIDKATNNIAFICKRFYALVLLKELGLNISPSNTYIQEHKTIESVVEKNILDLKNIFGLDVDESNQNLPHMYWLPKLHKSPSKACFIVAAPSCSIKPLSKAVTSVFKLFFQQIESYNKKLQFFSGINSFWVIQNNKPVVRNIKKLNSRNKAHTVSTFDFSTLYTKIPHDKLVSVMDELIDFCFRGGTNQHIAVSKYGAHWVTRPDKNKICFSKSSFKQAVRYLMNNCFFTVGTLLFRQIIGIPMGSDPAPFMANLFLYYYENKWINKLKKSDIGRARRYSNIFRFIDDLSAFNDGGEFQNNYREIYPPELELGKENLSDCQASFLDLNILITDNKYELSLIDKRDAFPFTIVRMPHRTSNIPNKMVYSSICAEVLRIGRSSTAKNKFGESVGRLIKRMVSQSARMDRTINALNKTFNRHREDLKHIADTSGDFITICRNTTTS